MLWLGYAYAYDCIHLWMIVFNYMIRLYNQDVLVRATPPPTESATDWTGPAAESATKWRASAAAGQHTHEEELAGTQLETTSH
jgi:hypothetical protein